MNYWVLGCGTLVSASESHPESLPGGLWAVASGLRDLDHTFRWMNSARPASAWSFRLPECSQAEAIACLRALRQDADWLAVHARFDWASLIGANAVVEGWRGLRRRQLPENLRLPCLRSTHELRECVQAAADGCVGTIFGPIWDTPSKHGLLTPRGLEQLAEACALGGKVIAIGAVDTPERVEQCLRAGAHAIAVLRSTNDHGLMLELAAASRQSC